MDNLVVKMVPLMELLISQNPIASGNLGDWRSTRRRIVKMASGQPVRSCVGCGRAIDWNANVCPYCGHDFRAVMAGGPQATGKKSFKGSLAILIVLIILCWPAGLIYFFVKYE
jgi:DNA-directed RNA polymerase subunit RPC12/RpoP